MTGISGATQSGQMMQTQMRKMDGSGSQMRKGGGMGQGKGMGR